jgi:hypothetical protein
MKSIKEKAEERAPYTKEDSWDRIKAAINAQTSFEAGANYVLDEIADVINQPMNDYLILNELKKVILQLKK